MRVGFVCDPPRLEEAKKLMVVLRKHGMRSTGITLSQRWQEADPDEVRRFVRDLTHIVALPDAGLPDWLTYLLGYAVGRDIPLTVVGTVELPSALSQASVVSENRLENHLIAQRSVWQQRHTVDLARARLRGRERDRDFPCRAASTGDLQLVDDLIAVGVSMDSRDSTGVPILVAAVRSRSEAIVQRVLAEGADPNAACGDNGETALCEAASRGLDQIVGILLSHNADPNARTTSGQTALMLAASQGHESVASHLLSAGADPTPSDSLGMTAVDYAKLFGKADAMSTIAAVLDSTLGDP